MHIYSTKKSSVASYHPRLDYVSATAQSTVVFWSRFSIIPWLYSILKSDWSLVKIFHNNTPWTPLAKLQVTNKLREKNIPCAHVTRALVRLISSYKNTLLLLCVVLAELFSELCCFRKVSRFRNSASLWYKSSTQKRRWLIFWNSTAMTCTP